MQNDNNNNKRFNVFFKVILWLSPIIVGLALAIGAYREKLSAMEIRVEAVETLSAANQIAIVAVTRDVVYIKEAVNRIEAKIDSNNRK